MQADQNLEAVYIDKHYNLVVECKQGSKKACYELYRLYSKAMLNVAFRIVENIAEEVEEDDEEVQYKATQVKDAIKLLPEGYRLVISLYLLEGYDHEEIGQILDISENTSRTQFLRAKRKLIEILNKKGIPS